MSTSIPTYVLKVTEAATEARMSRAFIYQKIASGELPSVKLGGARRILRSDLEAWLASHRQTVA